MCLELTKTSKKLKAKSDITCYKIVKVSGDQFTTPFQGSEVCIGNTYSSKISVSKYTIWKYAIFEGIHSFMKIEDCFKFVRDYNLKNNSYAIVECVIPKNAEYYRGYFHDNVSYASTEITYVKKITTITINSNI